MPSSEISLLSDNLQELYTAVHSGKEGTAAEVVPNIFGSRLYYSKAGWGRFWRVFFAVWGFCFGDSLKERKLKQAMQKTHTIFLREQENIKKTFDLHQKLLCAQFIEKKCDLKEFHKVRYEINDWNDKTLPFIRLLAKGSNAKLSTPPLNDLQPFPHEELLSTYGKLQAIIEVERLIEHPLPYIILKKLSLEISLAEDEGKTIEKWISLLNNKSKNLTLNKMRKALDVLLEFIEQYVITEQYGKTNLPLLCMELAWRGCEIFSEDDAKQTAWRETLKPGSLITCNENKYVLGKMLGKAKKYDKRHVYHIEGIPDKLLLVGNNKMILGIQQLMEKKLGWGIRPANWHEVDAQGKTALVEYLPHELNITSWTSTTILTQRDKKIAEILLRPLQLIVKSNKTPTNSYSKYLRLDSLQTLRNCKVSLQSQIFDFAALETIIFEYANGNLCVYQWLMKESGVNDHQYAKYYRDVVAKAIEDEEHDVKVLAALTRYQIIDAPIINHARKLYKEVDMIKKSILNTLNKEYDVHDAHQIRIPTQVTMRELFKRCGTASMIWPKFEQAVVNEVIKQQKLTVKQYTMALDKLV